MAGKKTKEKIGFKDLVTFAKAGWTPEETNALLDRLESIGDPNEPDEDLDDLDVDDDNLDEDDEDLDKDDEEDDTNAKMKKLEKTGNEILKNENERLKKELSKLKAKNRSKDVSGNNTKSCEDKLIDIFQDCVS